MVSYSNIMNIISVILTDNQIPYSFNTHNSIVVKKSDLTSDDLFDIIHIDGSIPKVTLPLFINITKEPIMKHLIITRNK